jgi:cytochrome c oxidase subunit 3
MSVSANASPTSAWEGGAQPFGISNAKMGMWLFIVSDSLTFAALLFAYGFVRAASPAWPRPFAPWPAIGLASVMTACLLASGLAMGLAVHAAHRGERTAMQRCLLATLAGGIASCSSTSKSGTR